MNRFYFIDGAMAYSALSASRYFSDRQAPWFASLMPHEDLRLAGPIVLEPAQLQGKDQAIEADAIKVVNSFPQRLHVSLIESELSLGDLANHLRRFVYFGDSLGQPYGLRIADCRVLVYLYRVLTPAQWDALTAPVATWEFHDRKGQRKSLKLSESRHQSAGMPAFLALNHEQIDQLIDFGEPDALLAKVNKEPEATAAADVQKNYDMANSCIEQWKASGTADRGALLLFARKVFASGGALLAEPAKGRQLLLNAAAMP